MAAAQRRKSRETQKSQGHFAPPGTGLQRGAARTPRSDVRKKRSAARIAALAGSVRND
jgi:hypothetical protein